MKRAVSISIGSSKRDKTVVIELLGHQVQMERIGTDGDMRAAAELYRQLDGKVDAFGIGGADIGLMVEDAWYPLYSVESIFRDVKKTPLVDGTGLKITLERRAADVLELGTGNFIQNRRALVITGGDRWGLTRSFLSAGYECVFGDLMFALNLPFPIRSERALKRVARLIMPFAGRLPFEWVYPTGEKQEERTPAWQKYFEWAAVIVGDCHYIHRYMPDRMDGKVIVTNTTTEEDVDFFQQAGVRYLLTTTPVIEGRSFGTNLLEAALVAAMGRTEPIDYAHPGTYFQELETVIHQLGLEPQLQEFA